MSMSLYDYLFYSETDLGLSPTDHSFLLNVAVRCNDDGRLCCSQCEMARGLRMGDSQFFKRVKKLEWMGLVTRKDGVLFFCEDIVKGSLPYRKDWRNSKRFGPATQTVHPLSDRQCHPCPADSVALSDGQCTPVPQTAPSRKEEKNKKENVLHGVSDGQAAHLGYAMSAKPYRGGGSPADDSQMGQPSRVQVVKAQPQPTWWEQRANMKSFAERLAEERERFNANKPTYTTEQEAFLSVYPKAPGDPVAFVLAWEQSIAQDVLPRELIDAARIASNSPAFKEKEGQFIPKPERWLGAKNWGPIVEPWRAERKRKAMQEDANQPPPDVDFDPFGKDLQDANVTSDIVVPFEVRDTSYWEPNEAEITRFRAVSSITAWINARNNKRALTKQPLRDAAREVLNFFLIQDMQSDKPYIPSNRIAWLNTNIVRVSPEETLTPEQAIYLARQDLNR